MYGKLGNRGAGVGALTEMSEYVRIHKWKTGKQRGRSGERLRRKGNDKATIITEKYGGKNRSKTGT
jgi:hypothetical protein